MSQWHELEDDASRATVVVQKLTSTKQELKDSLPRGTEPMPRRWAPRAAWWQWRWQWEGGGSRQALGGGCTRHGVQFPPLYASDTYNGPHSIFTCTTLQ